MKLQSGDIIAISSPKGWLPKKIRYFMRLWARKHYKVELDRYYNHTMIYLDPQTDEMAEAIGRGGVIHPFLEHYGDKLEHLIIFRLKDPLTEEECLKLNENALKMAKKNIHYEFFNFAWQAIYIATNGKINLSPRGSVAFKKVFCFELSNMLLDSVRPLFKKPSLVNTVDLMMDDRFENLYFD